MLTDLNTSKGGYHMSDSGIKIPKGIGIGEGGSLLPSLGPILQGLVDFVEAIPITKKTPVVPVAASGILTIAGVVVDGETVTIGADTYEIAADEAQTVEEGHIAVNVTAVTTAAAGTLTMATQPTVVTDTITIGDVVYTWVAEAVEAGQIAIGANVGAAQVNFVAAVNGTDGVNPANPYVTAADFGTNACILTAIVGGTAGNLIATTETFTDLTNAFDAGTLGTTVAGVDCTAANAVTAIVAATGGTEPVTLADGAGETVTVTADVKGKLANSIATTQKTEKCTFAKATLEGGIDGTVASEGEIVFDGTKMYISASASTVSESAWRSVNTTQLS